MAEQVQASLDQMVAPLRDLLDRHIFTEPEIRLIVSRRRESEYLLRRRVARKADFVRYIDAEMSLEQLRTLRTVKKKRDHRKSQRAKGILDDDDNNGNGDDPENNDNKDKEKDHIGDIHIVQHIHLLFVRLIRKFRSDVSLHLRHAEFCKIVKSWTRLGRVYAEALQIFPRESGIWIEAASHEFFGPNRSVKGARVLLQRALRLNEHNEELWLQYFSLESHYAQTLKGRQRILHPDKEDNDDDDDHHENTVCDNGIIKGNYHGNDYNKIPLVILRNAIIAIPDSVQFRLKFLDACKKFPDTSCLMDYIQHSMRRDFAAEPESWIARAVYEAEKTKQQNDEEEQQHQRPPKTKKARTNNEEEEDVEGNNNKNPVVKVLQEAIDAIPTSEMLIQAFRFAEDYRNELLSPSDDDEEVESSSNNVTVAVEDVDEFIHKIWEKADDMESSDLALEQTHYLLNSGGPEYAENAVKIIKAHCIKPRKIGVTTAPSEAWILWASLVTPIRKQKNILQRALRSISMDTHPHYVTVLLQLFGAQMKMMEHKDDDDDNEVDETSLFDTLQKILLLAPKTVDDVRVVGTGLEFELTDVFTAYISCLNLYHKRLGIQGARSIYEYVLFRSTVTLSNDNEEMVKKFIDRCLQLEQEGLDGNVRVDGNNKKRKHLRKLYDKAVEIFKDTSFEVSYREDRNEKCIFIDSASS